MVGFKAGKPGPSALVITLTSIPRRKKTTIEGRWVGFEAGKPGPHIGNNPLQPSKVKKAPPSNGGALDSNVVNVSMKAILIKNRAILMRISSAF